MKHKAPSQRQLRVGEEVKHVVAQILQRGKINDPVIEKTLLSVSEVQMSPDLKIATCYIALLGDGDKEGVVKSLNNHSRFIRGEASRGLRQMRTMPEFRFRLDTSFDNFSKIDALLKSPEVARDLRDEKDKD